MKKYIKYLFCIAFLFIIGFTVASCSGSADWEYTKADMVKFTELSTKLSKNDDDSLTVKIDNSESIFKNDIKEKYILFYNSNDIEDASYRRYEDVKDHLISIRNIKIDSSNLSFDFDGDYEEPYEIIIHKDVMNNGNFAMGYVKVNLFSNEPIVTNYEEKIIKTKGSWDDVQKGINLLSGVAQVILGFMEGNPIAIAGGTCGACGALGSIFFSGGPTLATVTKQLNIIDAKLDALTAQIDVNQKQILDEFVRTQAMIDEVKINQYNQNIQAYYTDYVKPIEDFMLVYKDMLEQEYRRYVDSSHTITLYYGNDNKLLFKSEQDITGATTKEYAISAFSNAKSYLEKNRGIVGDGYPSALYNDIKEALKNQSLPSGKSIDNVADDVYSTISEEVNQAVLTKEDQTLHSKVLQFVSDFVDFSKALSGINFESVINSYISRLEYIYNFSKEIKSSVRDLLANLKLRLDLYLCAAQTACKAQKINYLEEIADAYSTASDFIEARYESEMKIPDNYSYCLKNNVNVDLYQVKAEVSFTDLGNYPTFHANFTFRKNINFDGSNISGEVVDVNKINMVDYTRITAIVTRYNLLKSAGVTKSSTFINYIDDLSLLPKGKLTVANHLFDSGRTANPYRMLSSFGIRDINDSESFFVRCTCYGNPKSEYFYIGETRPYRYDDGVVEKDYWSGKLAYGDVLDAKSGQNLGSQRLAAYAKYSESHRLWVNDEHWGFVDDIFGNFYFIFTI